MMHIAKLALPLLMIVLVCLASINSSFAAKTWTVKNQTAGIVNVKIRFCEKKEDAEILFQSQLEPKKEWRIDFPDEANHHQLFCASIDKGKWKGDQGVWTDKKDKNVRFLVFGLWDATREVPEWAKDISISIGTYEIIDDSSK